MIQIPIVPRGHDKSVGSYWRGLAIAYLRGHISREDYLSLIATARVNLLHQDYEETCAWFKEQLESDNDWISYINWPSDALEHDERDLNQENADHIENEQCP